MKRVFIASPLRGSIKRNQRYARAALLDSLRRGEAPFAPHLLYTQVLDDNKEDERGWGMSAAVAMLGGCEVLAVYIDLGISSGMQGEIERATELGMVIDHRSIGRNFLYEEGRLVRRGPTWEWRDQDTRKGGTGVGTIVMSPDDDPDGWVYVLWHGSRLKEAYRVNDGFCDVVVIEEEGDGDVPK